MLLMDIKSVTRWLVMTEFEMLINILGLFATTILICLKIDFAFELTWKCVMMPMFIADGLQAYFCIIVFLRLFHDFQIKQAISRLIISGVLLTTRFLFKLFIYLMLTDDNENGKYRFQYAKYPLLLHLILLMFRSCCLKKYQVVS